MNRLALGPLLLPSRVLQSPMADCTDLPFRLIAREKGLAFACTEMISANSLVRANRKTLELARTAPADRPLAAQLLGSNPRTMAEAASILEGLGFDLVDINLGCSVRKVLRNGEGAALLSEPRKVRRIFQGVMGTLKRIPATVKMRAGFEDASGEEAVAVARIAQEEGLSAVAVHGRTARQNYSVPADYGVLARVKAAVRVPVIGNGDIFTPADAVRMAGESACDGVMVGRGGLGNPWLYRAIEDALAGGGSAPPSPSLAERRDTLLRHLAYEAELLGERSAALNMRRIGVWYTTGLPNAKSLRCALCAATGTAGMRGLIERFFGDL